MTWPPDHKQIRAQTNPNEQIEFGLSWANEQTNGPKLATTPKA